MNFKLLLLRISIYGCPQKSNGRRLFARHLIYHHLQKFPDRTTLVGVFYVKLIKTFEAHFYCCQQRLMLHCFSVHNSENLREVVLISQQNDEGFMFWIFCTYSGRFVPICRMSKILSSMVHFNFMYYQKYHFFFLLHFRNKDMKID